MSRFYFTYICSICNEPYEDENESVECCSTGDLVSEAYEIWFALKKETKFFKFIGRRKRLKQLSNRIQKVAAKIAQKELENRWQE